MSWRMVKIGDILKESKEVSLKFNPDKRIRVRLNVQGVEKRPLLKAKGKGTKYFIRRKGQFIYGKQNLFKGAFGIIPDELDGYESSSDIPAFDVHPSCLPEWIFLFFRQGDFYKKLERIATGTGSRRIQPKRLYDIEMPLPNISTQKKIIELCNKKEVHLDSLQTEIQTQKKLLTQLRQAILQEAIQGKLVSQDPTDEPASVLLERIKIEKAKLVATKQIRKSKYLPPIGEEEKPFELPDGWVWCRLGEVINEIEAGSSPKCHPYPASEGEYGVLKLSAVSWGAFNPNENKALPADKEPKIKNIVKKGDFLMTRANTAALIGNSVIVEEDHPFLLLNDKTLRVYFSSFFSKHYYNFINKSPFVRAYFANVASGTSDSMKNISRANIQELPLPLPSLPEQKRIVTKIQELLGYCDQLEKEILEREKAAKVLVQAVLREAFGKP